MKRENKRNAKNGKKEPVKIEIKRAYSRSFKTALGREENIFKDIDLIFVYPALRSFGLLKEVDSVEAALVGFTCSVLCWLLIIPHFFRPIYPELAPTEVLNCVF